jgi:hypothetical protein
MQGHKLLLELLCSSQPRTQIESLSVLVKSSFYEEYQQLR